MAWSLWGLLYANLIYLSMLGHGHSWWRLVIWQLVNWLAWAALTPVVLQLRRRMPIEPRWRSLPAVGFHLAAGVVMALVHLVPLAFATSRLQPYDAMTPTLSFAAAYRSSLGSWFRLDVVVYWAILAAATAWDSLRRARERELRAAELEGLLANARLEVLRLQLEPHFLFNTLHAAVGLIRQGEADGAMRLLVRLGDLLREVLARSSQATVPLADELMLVDSYLGIQQVRFPDLRVERRIDPASLGAELPSFILQPLLENAFEHGLASLGDARWVRLETRRTDQGLEVVVENPVSGDLSPTRGGLGLANCRRRLEALYGAAGQIRLEHLDGGTARVTLRLPVDPATAVDPAPPPIDPTGEASTEEVTAR